MPKGKKLGAPHKYTVEQMCQALDSMRGMIYLSADRLGCSPQTIYNYAKQYPKIQECIDRNNGIRLDRAEFKLDDRIDEGDIGAIKYLLNCKGKHRGFGEKSEIEHKHNFGYIVGPPDADPENWDSVVQDQIGESDGSSE